MKKTMLKRVVCAGVAAAMMLSLGACGKTNKPEMASKDNLYSSKEIPVTDFDGINTMTADAERIYIVGYKEFMSDTAASGDTGVIAKEAYGAAGVTIEETMTAETDTAVSESDIDTESETTSEEGSDVELPPMEMPIENEGYQKTIIAAYDFDGNKLSEKELFSTKDNRNKYLSIYNMYIANDKVCLLVNESSWNEETGESTENFYISRYNSDFSSEEKLVLDDLRSKSESEYFYVNSFVEDSEGNGYVLCDNNVLVIDKNGKYQFTVGIEQQTSSNSGSYLSSIIRGKNGKVYAFINSYSNVDDNYESHTVAKIIDFETQKFSDTEFPISKSVYGQNYSGSQYDVVCNGDSKLYGFDIESDTSTTIIDWIKSGIDSTALSNVFLAPDGRIVYSAYNYEASGGGYSYTDNDMMIYILTKLDPSEIPDKELISVYSLYIPYNIKNKISNFNKTSDKYQIEVTSYIDDDWSQYDDAIKRLNNDLVAGKIPDILIVDSSLPFSSYVSKGLIADLGPIMEKDESFNRADYLENVFEAFSVGGKLHRIAPSFSIVTMSAKKSIVGDKDSWTMDDFLAVHAANPDSDMQVEMTSSRFLQSMIVYNIGQYINYETGECSFNTDSFKKTLEYAKTLPAEIDYDSLYQDESYWMKRESSYREGKTILREEYIYNFRTIKQDEVGYFGEPITLIGVPSDNGSGSMLQINSSLAITAKAKNPDGAWNFIKTLLTDEAQESIGEFPIKLSALNKLAEKAKERPYWENEKGEKEYYDDMVWVGEQKFTVEPNTDEDNQRMMDFIKSVKNVYEYDADLFKIIDEETQAYFSGQKSVEEVVEIIQNRASTYISESR